VNVFDLGDELGGERIDVALQRWRARRRDVDCAFDAAAGESEGVYTAVCSADEICPPPAS